MSPIRLLFVAVSAAAVAHASPAYAGDKTSPSLDTIAINDNRTAAGSLQGTTLTVHLEAREGQWHPDRDSDPAVNVLAFGVDGGPLQIPGPLIKVVEGTEVHAFVRNRLQKEPLVLHGMYARTPGLSAAPDPITIDAGHVREVRFVLFDARSLAAFEAAASG